MNDVAIFISADGKVKLNVNVNDNTIWLSLDQISELFERDKSVISRHIKSIFEDEELDENRVVAKNATTASDGKNYIVTYYNLDVIISVGYRVKSKRGVQFRIWANEIIKNYMLKGFSIDKERLKNPNQNDINNIEELLSIIRDIRSSEKVFWRKILDLFATSIDYNASEKVCIDFFKSIQNKMHWATHGSTAAEVVYNRVDSNKENLGLTNFKGKAPTRQEVIIAKNYLNEEELNILNRMVSSYLDIAEINALSGQLMKMEDWTNEVDNFLKLTKKDILNHKGTISHKEALTKAYKEYDIYLQKSLSKADKDFLEVLNLDVKEIL